MATLKFAQSLIITIFSETHCVMWSEMILIWSFSALCGIKDKTIPTNLDPGLGAKNTCKMIYEVISVLKTWKIYLKYLFVKIN